MAVEYNIDPQGSELDTDALATDTVLHLGDAAGYTAPGTVEINGVRMVFVDADEDADTITLAAPLGDVASEGDRVLIVTAGEIAYDYTLEVQTSDGTSHEIDVDYGDRALWVQGPIDPPVPVTVSDDLTQIVDAPGRRAVVNPDAIENPLFVGYLDVNQPIPSGLGVTTVQNWQPQILRGGMVYDSSFHTVVVPIPGWYAVTNSAVAWEFNATGRRTTQPIYTTLAGAVVGGLFKQDASPDVVQQTTPVISPLVFLDTGEAAALTVSQNSGGSLSLIGDPTGVKSFFSVEYRGPL